MGYSLVKDMSANVLPEILELIGNSDQNCAFEIDGTCYGQPFKGAFMTYSECMSDKDLYGIINGCSYNLAQGDGTKDYWAGAVKKCGGVDKMPTLQQLAKIADYLYGTSGSGANANIYGTLDMAKFAAMGFPVESLYIWSNEEYNGFDSYLRTFYPDTSYVTNYTRLNANWYAVCVLGEEEDYVSKLCEKIKDTYNVSEANCSVTAESVESDVSDETMSATSPHIVFVNGLKLYIGTGYEELPELSDAEEERDRKGFKIYLDVNGESGKGKLWEDVYPFYLLGSGKVLLAYNEEEPSGGNTKENLSVNVIYDSYSGEKREVKLLMTDANFRSAACAIGYIKSEKYCGDKVQYDLCKDMAKDCRMMVKEPLKIF